MSTKNLEPQINADERRLNEKTERILGCAFAVSNILGCGFLEKVYENAPAHELRKAGFNVESQKPINVTYDGVLVGQYVADLLVDNEILIETKAVTAIDPVRMAQCMNFELRYVARLG